MAVGTTQVHNVDWLLHKEEKSIQSTSPTCAQHTHRDNQWFATHLIQSLRIDQKGGLYQVYSEQQRIIWRWRATIHEPVDVVHQQKVWNIEVNRKVVAPTKEEEKLLDIEARVENKINELDNKNGNDKPRGKRGRKSKKLTTVTQAKG